MVDLLRVKLSPTSVQRKSPLRREAHWGGRGELNAQENRVTVCPNIPVVSTATLVVHYLDENSGSHYAISVTRGIGSRLPTVPRNVL